MKDIEYPNFSFSLDYGGDAIDCEVIMRENSYDVLFNGELTASVEHTEEWTWIQASGAILPQEVIDEIGFQIEDKYK